MGDGSSQYVFNGSHQHGACWESFADTPGIWQVDLDLHCLSQVSRFFLTCRNMNEYNFQGLSRLESCATSTEAGDLLARETCSWRCKNSRPSVRCTWDFDFNGHFQLTWPAECTIRETCRGRTWPRRTSVVDVSCQSDASGTMRSIADQILELHNVLTAVRAEHADSEQLLRTEARSVDIAERVLDAAEAELMYREERVTAAAAEVNRATNNLATLRESEELREAQATLDSRRQSLTEAIDARDAAREARDDAAERRQAALTGLDVASEALVAVESRLDSTVGLLSDVVNALEVASTNLPEDDAARLETHSQLQEAQLLLAGAEAELAQLRREVIQTEATHNATLLHLNRTRQSFADAVQRYEALYEQEAARHDDTQKELDRKDRTVRILLGVAIALAILVVFLSCLFAGLLWNRRRWRKMLQQSGVEVGGNLVVVGRPREEESALGESARGITNAQTTGRSKLPKGSDFEDSTTPETARPPRPQDAWTSGPPAALPAGISGLRLLNAE